MCILRAYEDEEKGRDLDEQQSEVMPAQWRGREQAAAIDHVGPIPRFLLGRSEQGCAFNSPPVSRPAQALHRV